MIYDRAVITVPYAVLAFAWRRRRVALRPIKP